MANKVFKFVVEVQTEDEFATEQDARQYVFDAVNAHCGVYEAPSEHSMGHPMLNTTCLNVKRHTRINGQTFKKLKDVIQFKNDRIKKYRELLAQARAALEFVDYKQTLFKEIGVELTKEDQHQGY